MEVGRVTELFCRFPALILQELPKYEGICYFLVIFWLFLALPQPHPRFVKPSQLASTLTDKYSMLLPKSTNNTACFPPDD